MGRKNYFSNISEHRGNKTSFTGYQRIKLEKFEYSIINKLLSISTRSLISVKHDIYVKLH